MQATADEINRRGGTAIGIKADVTNRAEIAAMVKAVLDKFKKVDILVNNAGITRNAPLLELSGEDWDAVLAVDLKGVFNCIQAVSQPMMQQRYGKIISISSVNGTGTARGHQASYASAKGGVIQLTKVAARELGPYGINVNCVAPGIVETDMPYASRSKEEVEKHYEQRRKQAVLGRIGKTEDVANVVLFLASDDSSYITGQVICADGGRTDHI